MESLKNYMKYPALLSFFLLTQSFAEEAFQDRTLQKQQVLYSLQDYKTSIALYRDYQKTLGRHDFEVLQQLASGWIEQSARSPQPEKQILGIFGFGVAGMNAPPDILSQAIESPDGHLQMVCLQFLGKMQEDYADTLLNKAMSSPFFPIRLEAAYLLAQRKARSATGQIESLMYRLPTPMRYFFPEFFALIGTSEAIHILRELMDDSFPPTKTGAILSAAKYGRDDLLPPIRAAATHLNNAEQEACAAALGYLKDMRSIKKLKKLATHSSTQVQLAALYSLFLLGDPLASSKIAKEAEVENVFAINLLADMPEQKETLAPLLNSANRQVRFNAAMVLLKHKDVRSLPALLEFLIRDSKDLGFSPQTSVGGSLRAWKVISSLQQHAEESFFDIQALTIALKEQILTEAVELPEPYFIRLAEHIFATRQNELVPIIISLLETLRTPGAITLLKRYSQAAGAPLIRTYCNLSLFRQQEKGPYEEAIKNFAKQNQSKELIRLREPLPWHMRLNDQYHLAPEENSALLIYTYEALSNNQDGEGIDILLQAIENGHPHNLPVLAGILLQTLQ